MKINKLVVGVLAVVGAVASFSACADQSGIGFGVSTLGGGVFYQQGLTDHLSVTGGYNAFNYTKNVTENSTEYRGKIKLSTFELLGNWHPFANGFAIAAGVVYNDNRVTADANSTVTSVRINGVTYTGTNPSAHYSAKMDDNKFSPYIGLHWTSNPKAAQGLSFNGRIGVLHQTPKGTLSVSGVTDSTGTLEANRAAAESKLQDDLNKAKWYPVVGVGLSYAW